MAKVKLAYLHNTLFVPGHGEIKKELQSDGLNPTQMTVDKEFVTLVVKHAKTKLPLTVLVPTSNFSHLVLESEPAPIPPATRE